MGRTKQFDRNELLDDAIQLFWRQGYKDTSLSDLERATGVNKSGIYSEFKDKDDLFTAGLHRYIETQQAFQILRREPLGWQNLEDFLLFGSRCPQQKGCWVANCLREYPLLPKSARSTIEKHMNTARESVLANLEVVKTSMDKEVAAALLLTYNGGLALRLNLGPIDGVERQVKQFIATLKAD